VSPKRRLRLKKSGQWLSVTRKKAICFLLLLAFLSLYAAEFVLKISRQDAFTWMDPYQYYSFARDFALGIRAFNQFELPSIFPFFLVPFLKASPTITSALCANMFFLAMLLLAGYFLCDHFNIGKWYYVTVLSFLCSPLIIGLSHSLYAELALSALVAWQFVLWFKSGNFRNPWLTTLFVLVFCVGIMTKSTFPVFFIGPCILEAVLLLGKKDLLGLVRLSGIFLGPVAAVVLVQKLVFPNSFEYYLTGFYTQVPIMPLIGPSKVSWAASIGYYFAHTWKTMLFLLTPFLVLPLLPHHRKNKDLYLWMWFLVSLAVLTLPQVKEPRHVAPAVFPALMLMVLGISRIQNSISRMTLMALAVFLSLSQYLLVTRHLRSTPYFLDRPSYQSDILKSMESVDFKKDVYTDSNGNFDIYRWKFTKNFAITGYDPPMALALTWNLGPGVTYDIDFMKESSAKLSRFGFENFEDLYFLESFNIYNRQCLWNSNYITLDYQTVLDNADYLIAGEASPKDLKGLYPKFRLVQQWETDKGAVSLLQAIAPSKVSYRTLYARRYLAVGKLNPETYSALYLDLVMNASLRQDSAQIVALQKELKPRLDHMSKPKNIYWVQDRTTLIAQMNSYLKNKK
jgi:hypothetical protein